MIYITGETIGEEGTSARASTSGTNRCVKKVIEGRVQYFCCGRVTSCRDSLERCNLACNDVVCNPPPSESNH